MTSQHRRRGRAATIAAAAAAGLALAVGGSAQAATSVSVDYGQLNVSAFSGKKNVISISQFGSSFTVADSGDTVAAGSGCSAVNASTVTCPSAGVRSVSVNSGDQTDAITKRTSVPGLLQGGTGDDQIDAGPSTDWNAVYGGEGDDRLVGGANLDDLDGGAGADLMSGGGGTDRARYTGRSWPVAVTLDGVADDGEAGERDDVRPDVEDVLGGAGPDTLTGSAAANVLTGGSGGDVLNGLGGDDTLRGGLAADTENGGDGNDTFEQGKGADRRDVFNGGAGADTVSYAARTAAGVVVDIDGVDDDGIATEHDNVQVDVERVVGSPFDDALTGSALANLLLGGAGNDTLSGLGGADTLRGDAGDDSLVGGDGDDTLDSVDGALGNDSLDGQANSDTCSFDRIDAWTNCEALAVFP